MINGINAGIILGIVVIECLSQTFARKFYDYNKPEENTDGTKNFWLMVFAFGFYAFVLYLLLQAYKYSDFAITNALSHFNGSDITGIIKYEQIDDELMASDFTLRNDDLEINLACADPSLSFMEMSEDETLRAFGTDNNMFSFELLNSHIDKMKSLFNLDKEDETFTLEITEKGVNVKGSSYNANITHTYEGGSGNNTVVIYKKYINLLDKESYKVTVCENKVVFHSLDTETSLTVAVAVVDED